MTHTLVYPITASHNAAGHLEVDGCDVVDLVAEFGTPLIIYEEKSIRDQCRRYMAAFREHTDDFEVIYASKAFSSVAVNQLVLEEGLSIDVSSGGEYHVAKVAGFPAERIFFHGNNKTREELEYALVGGRRVRRGRQLPGAGACSRSWWRPGGARSGSFCASPRASRRTRIRTSRPGRSTPSSASGWLTGWRSRPSARRWRLRIWTWWACTPTSAARSSSWTAFRKAIEILVKLIGQAHASFGFDCRYLNVGGGLGIRYTEEDTPSSIGDYATVKVEGVREEMAAVGLPMPRVLIEPGRSIVGKAGITAYRVGTIKEIPGVRTYVSVDGGMSDNIRPMLYDAQYEGMLANKADAPADTTVTVAGKHCESGDILIRDAVIARPEPGDILVMPATGAYCYAMASNYNGSPRPAVDPGERGSGAGDHRTRELRGSGGEAPSAAGLGRRRGGRGMEREQRTVRIGLLGFGTIGSSVYRLIQKEHDQILEGTGVDLQVAKVLGDRPGQGPGRRARRSVHRRLRRDRRRSVHRHRGGGHRRHRRGLHLPRRGHAQGQERGHGQQAAPGLPR